MKLNKLLLAQFITHASICPMIYFGRSTHYSVSLLVYFFTGCFGMTMTYHRFLSHKSWEPPKWFLPFGLFCGTISLTGPCLAWAAVHRRHHQKTDTKGDPHSPYVNGFWRVQYLSMLEPVRLSWFRKISSNYWDRFFHRNYWTINLIYVFTLSALDPFSIIYAYLFPAALLWNAGSFVNTIGHYWGSKRYSIGNQSRNNALLALITWGEGWHNNHHKYPLKSYFGTTWYEIDIAGLLIKILNRKRNKI